MIPSPVVIETRQRNVEQVGFKASPQMGEAPAGLVSIN